MKEEKLRAFMPALLAVIMIVMIGAGLVRRCSGGERTGIAGSFRRPGNDTLAVAIEMSPLTYTFENDTADGLDYGILKAIAGEHGIPLAFYPVSDLERAFYDLYSGKYDLLVAAIPATVALREYFPLTDAVYIDRQVLVQRRDSSGNIPVRSQLDLRGDTVWLAPGSPARLRMGNIAEEVGDTIYLRTMPGYSQEHLAIMTANGEIRHAVISGAVARRIATDYPDLDISTPLGFSQFQVWAVSPGDSVLLDSLNTWLRQFRLTDAYGSLCGRYL